MPGQPPVGKGHVVPRAPMRTFELVPPRIREAMRESLYDWDHSMVIEALASGMSEQEIIDGIKREDREKAAADRVAVWNIQEQPEVNGND